MKYQRRGGVTVVGSSFWLAAGCVALYVLAQISPLARMIDPGFWPLGPLWAAYGWSRGGPSVRTAFVLLALGLLQDVVSGGPVGLWPFAYVGAYVAALAVPAGLTDNALLARGVAAGLAVVTCGVLAYAAAGYSLGASPPITALMVSLAITAILTPFAGYFFPPPKRKDV